MKIAFDGTVLHGRKSGVGYYCEELLNAMLEMDHDDQFFVFSHQRLDLKLRSANGNLEFSDSRFFPVRAVYLHALLPKILDDANPDLCHYTNFLAPIAEDRPYVVTIHDMGLEVLRNSHPMAKRIYTRRLIPRVARNARLILANSEYSKWEVVRHLGIPEERIRVTPLAASPQFKPVTSKHENPYFLFVGNLEPRKNLERLIEAFAEMPEKDHELVIVGNYWYRAAEVENKARSMGLSGRVKFRGYIGREELPGLYSGATALVYPSLLEGFGLPVVEAMACGTPVITSNNSALKEVAGDAAVLVDPLSVRELTQAMARLAEDAAVRSELSRRGLARAAEFSWKKTAELTLDAYREALRPSSTPGSSNFELRISNCSPDVDSSTRPIRPVSILKIGPLDKSASGEQFEIRSSKLDEPRVLNRQGRIIDAIHRTIAYANFFQYPLTPDELRERLFDVEVDAPTFQRVLRSLDVTPSEDLLRLRAKREAISDRGIREVNPHLRTLVSFPFVRMLAFSGATAHRNMSTPEDIDLFMVVEDGKVWAVFLLAMIWAKVLGLRRRLCLNYVISDSALPIAEHDTFTAQQVASLKPIHGKYVYDRFISMNSFVYRRFPNFDPVRHREMYAELQPKSFKAWFEAALLPGPIQLLERMSRAVLRPYLKRKVKEGSDVQLDARRLKLHMRSHKFEILNAARPLESVHSNPE
jgi:glycosyltransferase involved in cell wall biosynthesis